MVIIGLSICGAGFRGRDYSTNDGNSTTNSSQPTTECANITNSSHEDEGVSCVKKEELGELGLLPYVGAVVMGFGCFIIIVAGVVFCEQREKVFKQQIEEEEKAKKRRGYKAKPKRKGAFERFIAGIIRCTNECSQPIKLKEKVDKPDVVISQEVLVTQPSRAQAYTTEKEDDDKLEPPSQNSSLSSMGKALKNLPEFKTIDFLYREDEERPEEGRESPSGMSEKDPETDERRDEEHEDMSDPDKDSMFSDRSPDDDEEEDGEDGENEIQELNHNNISKDNSEENRNNKNKEETSDIGINNSDAEDDKDEVKAFEEDDDYEEEDVDEHSSVITPGRREQHRVPLISDHVTRLTCGIARTNAQAMDRARKPLPVQQVLKL